MSIIYKPGQDMFEDISEGNVLVNPVNCVGVMGKGLALQFKQRFPVYYTNYTYMCEDRSIALGTPRYNKTNEGEFISFPTKHHWRDESDLESIERGLKALSSTIRYVGWRNYHFPMLGCGLGGLDWKDVQPLVHKFAIDHKHYSNFIIYGETYDT